MKTLLELVLIRDRLTIKVFHVAVELLLWQKFWHWQQYQLCSPTDFKCVSGHHKIWSPPTGHFSSDRIVYPAPRIRYAHPIPKYENEAAWSNRRMLTLVFSLKKEPSPDWQSPSHACTVLTSRSTFQPWLVVVLALPQLPDASPCSSCEWNKV